MTEDKETTNLKMQEIKIKDSLRRISEALKGEIANNWITNVVYIE